MESEKAHYLCSILKSNVTSSEVEYEKNFVEKFRDAISYEKFMSILKGLSSSFGDCHSVHSIDGVGSFAIILRTKNDKKLHFELSYNKISSMIDGLLFKGEYRPKVNITSYSQAINLLKEFGQSTSLYLTQEQDELASFRADSVHALGSVFKLYILAALAKKIESEGLSWQEKITIKNDFKSLPSGVMQDLPEGSQKSLYEFSEKMISISDNTATDHLLNFVGKKEVESFINEYKLNSSMNKNSPFLSTFDMFKTRAFFSNADVRKYIESNRMERAKMLSKYANVSQSEVMSKLSSWSHPKYINEIEWYATPREVCKLMSHLTKLKDPQVKKILSVNTPFVSTAKDSNWIYAGYKGGSEPGVLEMAYVLENKSMKESCFYIGVNDPVNPVDQSSFFSLVEGILTFISTKI